MISIYLQTWLPGITPFFHQGLSPSLGGAWSQRVKDLSKVRKLVLETRVSTVKHHGEATWIFQKKTCNLRLHFFPFDDVLILFSIYLQDSNFSPKTSSGRLFHLKASNHISLFFTFTLLFGKLKESHFDLHRFPQKKKRGGVGWWDNQPWSNPNLPWLKTARVKATVEKAVGESKVPKGVFGLAPGWLFCIGWIWPPHSNSGEWRFIGIPYYKCNNPGGHCYCEGATPNV